MNNELYKAYYKNGTVEFISACDWVDAIFLIMGKDSFYDINDLIKLELATKEEKERVLSEQ